MDDTISRQAAIATAIKAAVDWHKLANPQYSIAYCIGEAMRQLPPANNSENPNSSDTISRAKAIDTLDEIEAEVAEGFGFEYEKWRKYFCDLPPAQSERIIRCKDCKHFEYNHVETVNGIPLIVAHEICMRWGDGVKTSENGYCFLAERKEVTE